MERARQIVFNWAQRAIALGYLQEIPPFAAHFEDAGAPRGGLSAVAGQSFFPEPTTFGEGCENVVPL